MMARFISMPIGSDTALNIMCSRNVIRQLYREQFIQPVAEPIFASFVHISLYILWYIPGILYSKSFRNIPPSIYRSGSLISYRSKRCTPVSLTVLATHILRFRINQSLIRECTIQEITVIILFTQSLGSLCHAIIIIRIFQCFRH